MRFTPHRLIEGTFGVLIIALLLTVVVFQTGLLPVSTGTYEERDLRMTDCNETTNGMLTVDVASSFSQQYIGLSRTESLPRDEGMLFPGENEREIRIEMRNMNYDLDIIFVDSNGRITSIKTGNAPQNTVEYYLTYESVTGEGQHVIETNKGWTDRNNVGEGDCVEGIIQSA